MRFSMRDDMRLSQRPGAVDSHRSRGVSTPGQNARK
jgi:hypothetical protein